MLLSFSSARKFPGFISCIWIREAAEGDNSAERFAAAFAGIAENKRRVFKDSEIPALANIDLANGEC